MYTTLNDNKRCSPVLMNVKPQILFLSYAHEDVEWAEWIASTLERNGHTAIVSQWDFKPGSNFVLEMDRALKASDRVLALLSPAFIVSQYTQPEWAGAFAQDPTGEKGRLIPIRIRDCILEGLLSQIVYVDLVGLDREQATHCLLRSVVGERMQPDTPPAFPGGDALGQLDETAAVAVRYSENALPDVENLGFIDYVVLGTSSLKKGNRAASRFVEKIRLLNEKNLERAEEFTRLGRQRAGARKFQAAAQSTAEGMNQFATDSIAAIQEMGLGWEIGLTAWRRCFELLPGFGGIDEDSLRENLVVIDSMIRAIPQVRRSVTGMRDSTLRLPNLERNLSAAKREVARTLETAIRTLDRTLKLAIQTHDVAMDLMSRRES